MDRLSQQRRVSHLHALFVYSVDQGKSYQLTDGMSDVPHVASDKGG